MTLYVSLGLPSSPETDAGEFLENSSIIKELCSFLLPPSLFKLFLNIHLKSWRAKGPRFDGLTLTIFSFINHTTNLPIRKLIWNRYPYQVSEQWKNFRSHNYHHHPPPFLTSCIWKSLTDVCSNVSRQGRVRWWQTWNFPRGNKPLPECDLIMFPGLAETVEACN